MPALVDSMFSVREMPWHRQGQVLAEYPGSWAAAREQAGLTWDPIEEPNYGLVGIDTEGRPIYEADKDWKRIVHSKTGQLLSVRSRSYTLITNADMGPVVEAVLDVPGVKYETAGSLDSCRAVWCLARLDEPIHLPGDPDTATYPFMALTNRHDGQGGCTARATAVRIVCANTLRAAELEGEKHGATFTFRHTANWRDRIEQAREAVTGARREMRRYVELSEELLKIRVTPAQTELWLGQFIPAPPEGIISDKVMGNIEEARNAVRRILASDTTAAVAHTGYGLVQAAVEYLDHVRKYKTWESKLGRTMMRPEPLKRRALLMVRELVKV